MTTIKHLPSCGALRRANTPKTVKLTDADCTCGATKSAAPWPTPPADDTTPRPWRVAVGKHEGEQEVFILSRDGVVIAKMEDNADRPAVNRADARLIVRAVNALKA